MIERMESGGTLVTGEDVTLYRVLTIRRGLILKVDTGLALTRLSPLLAAQADGITSKRTYRGALKDVNRWLKDHGVGPVWSKTYPNG